MKRVIELLQTGIDWKSALRLLLLGVLIGTVTAIITGDIGYLYALVLTMLGVCAFGIIMVIIQDY